MPAPPDESEPATVSAMGMVIVLPAGISADASGSYALLARHVIASKFSSAILHPAPLGDDSDGSLFRPVQMQAWPVLRRRQRARRGRDCLGDVFYRGRL